MMDTADNDLISKLQRRFSFGTKSKGSLKAEDASLPMQPTRRQSSSRSTTLGQGEINPPAALVSVRKALLVSGHTAHSMDEPEYYTADFS